VAPEILVDCLVHRPTNYASNATYSDIKSSYSEFLPSLDTSLQVLPDVLLRASYSKTISRSDLLSMIGTTSVTNSPKPCSRTATAGNPGLLPYESNNFDLAAEWYYAKGSYVSANWFTKHVTNFLTQTTTQAPLFGITDPNAGALATQGHCGADGRRSGRVGAEHIRADPTGHRIIGPVLGAARGSSGDLGHHGSFEREQNSNSRL